MFYSSGHRVFDYYGLGTGPIWLYYLGCYGFELTLLQCSRIGIGRNKCNRYKDVSMWCFGSKTGSLF